MGKLSKLKRKARFKAKRELEKMMMGMNIQKYLAEMVIDRDTAQAFTRLQFPGEPDPVIPRPDKYPEPVIVGTDGSALYLQSALRPGGELHVVALSSRNAGKSLLQEALNKSRQHIIEQNLAKELDLLVLKSTFPTK